MFELLQELCLIPAAPGCEKKLAEHIRELLEPLADEVFTDRLGSVVGKIEGTGARKKKILFAAHMDEVAGMVSKIEDSGMIRFANDGFPRWNSACYHPVTFENGAQGMLIPIPGDKAPSEKNCYIDIGASSKEEAAKLVEVGETFTFPAGIIRLAGKRVSGHPVDDRVGCAIQLEAARRIRESGVKPYNDVYFAFTAQEETVIPSVGASVVAWEVQPDIGIGVDVCDTGDIPGADAMDVSLGGGAAILVRDVSIVADRELVREMKEAAKENGIPYQLEVSLEGGNDAVPMQKVGKGCRAGLISIPMRYLHTNAEQSDLGDAEACVALTVALARREMSR